MTNFSGTGVALVTPFLPNGILDLDALRKLVKYVSEGGVEFLVALGTTGETSTLSRDEQRKVLDTIFEANQGDLPVVIGMGGNHTAGLVTYAREIEQAYHPAAFLTVTPYYNKPNQAGLYQHYAALASSVHSDIILYNVPGRTAVNMLPDTSLKLAESFPNIVAIKEASGNLEQCMALVQGRMERDLHDFQLLSGDDMLGIAQIASGFDGIISVAANAIPGPFSDMIRAATKSDMPRARELHYQWLHLMNLHFKEGNPAGVKYSLKLAGICEQGVRLPLVEASRGLKDEIGQAWEKARA